MAIPPPAVTPVSSTHNLGNAMSNPLIQNGKHTVTKEKMDAAEVIRRQRATAMKSPEHLKQWLQASGHAWLVFNTQDLIDSLPWPFGVEMMMDLVHTYSDHRCAIDSGRREVQKEPITGKSIEVVIYKDQTLEVEELDRCIRHLTAQIYQLKPDWSLTDTPL